MAWSSSSDSERRYAFIIFPIAVVRSDYATQSIMCSRDRDTTIVVVDRHETEGGTWDSKRALEPLSKERDTNKKNTKTKGGILTGEFEEHGFGRGSRAWRIGAHGLDAVEETSSLGAFPGPV